MVVFPASRIDTRFHRRGWAVAISLYLLIVLYVVIQLFMIFHNIYSPPTVVTVELVNGKNFGAFPYFVIACGIPSPGTRNELRQCNISDAAYDIPAWGAMHNQSFHTRGNSALKTTILYRGTAVIFDTSMLVPKSGRAHQSTSAFNPTESPNLYLKFNYCPGDFMFFGFIEPDVVDPVAGLHSSTHMISNIHIDCYGTTKIQGVSVRIEREYVPKNHIFWGLPGEASVRPLTTFHPAIEQIPVWIDKNSTGQDLRDFIIEIIVDQKTIRKTVPVGVIYQCISVLSGLGGMLSIGSGLFGIWFVYKYPKSMTLTARGHEIIQPDSAAQSLITGSLRTLTTVTENNPGNESHAANSQEDPATRLHDNL